MLLKADKVDKTLNITENKTSSIIDILFLKYCLDLELLHLSSWRFFSEYFKKKKSFLNTEWLLPEKCVQTQRALGMTL